MASFQLLVAAAIPLLLWAGHASARQISGGFFFGGSSVKKLEAGFPFQQGTSSSVCCLASCWLFVLVCV